jgi:YD repeat-containing protein
VKTSFKCEGDRLVEVTDAVGGTWGLEYDEKGRLAKRTNPLGQALKYFYGEKHLVGVADAAEQRTEVDFDAAGNLVEAQPTPGVTGVRPWASREGGDYKVKM